jgi:hypothetical protein
MVRFRPIYEDRASSFGAIFTPISHLNKPQLLLHSSKTVNKGTSPMPSGLLCSAPHPRFRS